MDYVSVPSNARINRRAIKIDDEIQAYLRVRLNELLDGALYPRTRF